MAALVSLGAGLWYIGLAAATVDARPWHAISATLFGAIGALLITAGASPTRGRTEAGAAARRAAWLMLTVTLALLGLWAVEIALADDWDRIPLAVRQGLPSQLAMAAVPALAVLVAERTRAD